MLGVNKYDKKQVDACRKEMNALVAGYQKDVRSSRAPTAFESRLFNNLVIALDGYFVHRLRGMEGKSGNALNEVRLIVSSLTSNGGKMVADKQIKMDPAQSVLGYAPNDKIALSAADFSKLSKAFLDEIAKVYT